MFSTSISAVATRRFVAALALALAGLATPACADAKATPASTPGGPSAPVAEVGGKTITMGELEQALAPQLTEVDRQRRQILEQGLGGVIEQKILEAEAAARGISIEELYKAEIESKVGTITDEEASTWYEANKQRVNRPLDQILPQLKSYLANLKRSSLREELVAALRVKYAPRVLLEPLRAAVAEAGSPAKGPAGAPVTMVEFSDFQCPYCSRVLPSIRQAQQVYGDQVRLVFRQYPLVSIHPNAQKAAEASLCAFDQGKFWELHDAMFANQQELGVDQLKAKAAALGLDAAKFNACLDSGEKAAKIASDTADGSAIGVNGTPALFINGRFLNGAVPFGEIAKIVDDELMRKGITPKKAG
jgi:protein-disulfide isomerase